MTRLILPEHLREKPAYQCRLCGGRFYKHEHARYERHVVKCAAKHRDVIEEASPRNELMEADFEHDTELEEYMRRYR